VAYFQMLENNEENHNTSLPIAGLLSKMYWTSQLQTVIPCRDYILWLNNTMFNHNNVKENMKMTKNGDLRTVEMCRDTCSMYPPLLT
jgi:hypothetical protein